MKKPPTPPVPINPVEALADLVATLAGDVCIALCPMTDREKAQYHAPLESIRRDLERLLESPLPSPISTKRRK